MITGVILLIVITTCPKLSSRGKQFLLFRMMGKKVFHELFRGVCIYKIMCSMGKFKLLFTLFKILV